MYDAPDVSTFRALVRQALTEDVGPGDHRAEQRPVGRVLDVKDDGLLAPVQPDEVRGLPVHGPVVAAREVTAGPLDLDDPRAQVGELPGGERRGDRLFKRDDGNPLKRQVIHPAIIAAQKIHDDALLEGRMDIAGAAEKRITDYRAQKP